MPFGKVDRTGLERLTGIVDKIAQNDLRNRKSLMDKVRRNAIFETQKSIVSDLQKTIAPKQTKRKVSVPRIGDEQGALLPSGAFAEVETDVLEDQPKSIVDAARLNAAFQLRSLGDENSNWLADRVLDDKLFPTTKKGFQVAGGNIFNYQEEGGTKTLTGITEVPLNERDKRKIAEDDEDDAIKKREIIVKEHNAFKKKDEKKTDNTKSVQKEIDSLEKEYRKNNARIGQLRADPDVKDKDGDPEILGLYETQKQIEEKINSKKRNVGWKESEGYYTKKKKSTSSQSDKSKKDVTGSLYDQK